MATELTQEHKEGIVKRVVEAVENEVKVLYKEATQFEIEGQIKVKASVFDLNLEFSYPPLNIKKV
jgi:hypothetical protein